MWAQDEGAGRGTLLVKSFFRGPNFGANWGHLNVFGVPKSAQNRPQETLFGASKTAPETT